MSSTPEQKLEELDKLLNNYEQLNGLPQLQSPGTEQELNEYLTMPRELIEKQTIENLDATVTGFNIGANNGKSAGQTIFHCHIHLIPRREGDVKQPRGGIRCVIPGKGSY